MSVTEKLPRPVADRARSLKAHWLVRMLRRRDLDPAASIIICSEPRSGSTWLMELFDQLPGSVCDWEPLHPTRGVLPGEWNMGWRPVVPEAEADPRLEAWFDDLLRFRIGNSWTLSHIDRHAAGNAEIGVHKFVRAALLLPWMVTHLRLDRRPVWLMRHPWATVSSQITNFSTNRADPEIVGDDGPIDEYASIVAEQTEPALILFARWCYRHRAVLDLPHRDERLIVVHYEHLVLEPKRTFERILGELGLAPELSATVADFGRPSRSDWLSTVESDPGDQLGKWLDQIDPEFLGPAQELLDRFGITCYRSDEVMPTP